MGSVGISQILLGWLIITPIFGQDRTPFLDSGGKNPIPVVEFRLDGETHRFVLDLGLNDPRLFVFEDIETGKVLLNHFQIERNHFDLDDKLKSSGKPLVHSIATKMPCPLPYYSSSQENRIAGITGVQTIPTRFIVLDLENQQTVLTDDDDGLILDGKTVFDLLYSTDGTLCAATVWNSRKWAFRLVTFDQFVCQISSSFALRYEKSEPPSFREVWGPSAPDSGPGKFGEHNRLKVLEFYRDARKIIIDMREFKMHIVPRK